MEKTCFKCNELKPLTAFYKHNRMADGHLNKCKDCAKTDVSANYRANISHYTEYEKARFKKADRKKQLALYQKRRRTKHPEKYRANYLTGNAIRDGRLIRQPCEQCGDIAQAHHDDYSKPLDVRWLCFKHHLEHHGKERRAQA